MKPQSIIDIEDLARSIPMARSNLARFDIHANMPAALAMLIIDVFERIPEPAARHFPAQIAKAIQPDADLSLVPAQFLLWLLSDPTHGLANLTQREDLKAAVEQVSTTVIAPQAKGLVPQDKSFKSILFNAEITQLKAWHAYRSAEHDSIKYRIEWMIATAAVDAITPQSHCSLSSAMQSAAVAWAAAHRCTPGHPSFRFFQLVAEQLLALIAQQPIQSHPGGAMQLKLFMRVTFDDPEEGPQTGTLLGWLGAADIATTAVVEVDHSLPGVTWKVPIATLTPHPTVPA